jgi:hypothetical protein
MIVLSRFALEIPVAARPALETFRHRDQPEAGE